jgi:hypothetical protein
MSPLECTAICSSGHGSGQKPSSTLFELCGATVVKGVKIWLVTGR